MPIIVISKSIEKKINDYWYVWNDDYLWCIELKNFNYLLMFWLVLSLFNSNLWMNLSKFSKLKIIFQSIEKLITLLFQVFVSSALLLIIPLTLVSCEISSQTVLARSQRSIGNVIRRWFTGRRKQTVRFSTNSNFNNIFLIFH